MCPKHTQHEVLEAFVHLHGFCILSVLKLTPSSHPTFLCLEDYFMVDAILLLLKALGV